MCVRVRSATVEDFQCSGRSHDTSTRSLLLAAVACLFVTTPLPATARMSISSPTADPARPRNLSFRLLAGINYSSGYVGCVIKYYLPDFSLCIMVCAIFNQYHAQIASPLQALCLFLTEYSGYDGATHAITLQGLVPLDLMTDIR